jgi:hypothetical protein
MDFGRQRAWSNKIKSRLYLRSPPKWKDSYCDHLLFPSSDVAFSIIPPNKCTSGSFCQEPTEINDVSFG